MTDVGAASSSPVNADSRYYSEGASWENDVARRNKWSRNLAWTVAFIASLLAIGAIGALLLALPLKQYEPYMVVVDKSSGFVEVKRALDPGNLAKSEAMTMFDVVRYVKARETYDPRGLKDSYELAQVLATGQAARDLAEIYSPANPFNPVKQLGSNTTISVEIKSVTFPNAATALVRFSTAERGLSTTVNRHWVSLVRFRYTNSPKENAILFENPLGFQVTEYRRDQESAPSAGATQ